jgi:hypothetical protein
VKDLLVLLGVGVAVVGMVAVALTFMPVISGVLTLVP